MPLALSAGARQARVCALRMKIKGREGDGNYEAGETSLRLGETSLHRRREGCGPKRAATGKCGGMPSLAETRPEMVELARRLRHTRSGRQRSLREISAELAARGFVAERSGRPFAAAQISRLLEEEK